MISSTWLSIAAVLLEGPSPSVLLTLESSRGGRDGVSWSAYKVNPAAFSITFHHTTAHIPRTSDLRRFTPATTGSPFLWIVGGAIIDIFLSASFFITTDSRRTSSGEVLFEALGLYASADWPSSSLASPPSFFAFSDAVKASIFFSSSATLLSVFFCLFRLGAVTTQFRLAFAHLLQGRLGSSWSHRTLSPRQASQALDRFGSFGSPFILEESQQVINFSLTVRFQHNTYP